MPVTYRVHGDLVELLFEGEFPLDDVFKTFHEMLDDPACPDKILVLLDVRKSATLATRPTGDIVKVAEYIGPYKDRITRCAVVASSDVHYGLSRMGAVYSESRGVLTSVFRNREDAVAWLRGQVPN